jgi:ABC-2 type transport system permease protein
MQPILYIVLFGPLLEPLAGQLGSANAYQIFVPGILVQLGIFGALFVGFGLIAEWRAGVIESQRVTPASRTALLLGRVLRDVVVLLVQGTCWCWCRSRWACGRRVWGSSSRWW